MAVYTHVTKSDLDAFLQKYDLGALVDFEGVTQGVENTNYFIDLAKPDASGADATRRYVLTIFEKRVDPKDLPYFLAAMECFSASGAPAPYALPMRDGEKITRFNGKPAIIISFLPGKQRMTPTPADAAQFGAALAQLHRAGADFPLTRKNGQDLSEWRRLAAACSEADRRAPGLATLISEEMAWLSERWPADLPSGLAHLDLFPDNVFFDDKGVSGIIDFYFAANEAFAYDLAITVNAWASLEGGWRQENAAALITAYEKIRPLSQAERAAAPILFRGAAMRFLLTRLYDWLNQVDGAVVNVKDPLEYRDILLRHRASDLMQEL